MRTDPLAGAGPKPSQHELVASRGMRIGILIVAYNAVGTLVSVLRRIPHSVWEQIEEVAVFDDASRDSTYELAVGYKTLSDAYKLQIFKNERNLGYGGNQKAGYRYFMEKGFDAVVLLHGDGQYAPEILHHLYHPIVAGNADAVLGSRMMPDYGGALRGRMPLYKYVGNRILTTLENRGLGMKLTEFHSGYRAYSLDAVRRIEMSAMTDDFHFDTEMIIKLHHQGFRIQEVPIPTYYGDEICYVNGLRYAFDVVRAVQRYKSTVRSARRFPEFAEYFIRYPLKESAYSSHSIVARHVGPNQDVLDVGCGEGYFAAAMALEGNNVTGIDIIPAPRHREAFATYVCADLNDGFAHVFGRLGKAAFDRILMLDVLQQLADPEPLLQRSISLLKRNGQVIVSLPNVANVTTRLGLLFGRFEYSDRGILDHSHVRFFTRRTARTLLRRAGFTIVSERASVMPLEFVFDLASNTLVMRAMNRILAFFTALFPTLLGYQWIFVARPDDGEGKNPETG
jgi:2-polyprenyl-3-methyl-5-hydroxy-6-metoxy-1,4-benzoquinol methylase